MLTIENSQVTKDLIKELFTFAEEHRFCTGWEERQQLKISGLKRLYGEARVKFAAKKANTKFKRAYKVKSDAYREV